MPRTVWLSRPRPSYHYYAYSTSFRALTNTYNIIYNIFRSFGLAYRNCLRASFYTLFQFFPHGRCTHICTAQRSSGRASQLRQSKTSTAHGDPSLAAPMLTARFSYTIAYKLALYIVRATQAHSPARGIAPARP